MNDGAFATIILAIIFGITGAIVYKFHKNKLEKAEKKVIPESLNNFDALLKQIKDRQHQKPDVKTETVTEAVHEPETRHTEKSTENNHQPTINLKDAIIHDTILHRKK